MLRPFLQVTSKLKFDTHFDTQKHIRNTKKQEDIGCYKQEKTLETTRFSSNFKGFLYGSGRRIRTFKEFLICKGYRVFDTQITP